MAGLFDQVVERRIWDMVRAARAGEADRGRIVEIGSAPGLRVLKAAATLGMDPYGIEYSDVGARKNRQVFAAAGVPEDHVIERDFFDEQLVFENRSAFDVVCSFGFVEHFAAARQVVERHLEFLRPGGLLVVSIPNYGERSRYHSWLRRFRPGALELHNLPIMNRVAFQELFQSARLTGLYCGPFGVLDLAAFSSDASNKARFVSGVLCQAQIFVNGALRMSGCRIESESLSPRYLYVGRKDA